MSSVAKRISAILAALILLIGGGVLAYSLSGSKDSNAADAALINPETGFEYPNHIVNGSFDYYADTIFSFHDEWVPFDDFGRYINRKTGAIQIATYCSRSGWHTFSGYDESQFGWVRSGSDEIAIVKDTVSGNRFGLLNKDDEIYQDIVTIPGAKYAWSVRHNTQNMASLQPSIQVLIGKPGKLGAESAQDAYRSVSNGNDPIGDVGKTITSNFEGKVNSVYKVETRNGVDYAIEFLVNLERGWETYTGTYTVPPGQTLTRFTFRNTDQQGLGAGSGVNVIDDVIFSVLCPISFVDPLDNDKVLRSADVPAYTAATPPEIPEHKGYTFKGYVDEDGNEIDIASISKPGNIYLHYELDLVIEVAPDTDGHGSATVSWPSYDYRNKNFKVYQSADNGATWNSVGIDYTSVTSVRCLQIYPNASAANQLRTWMEANDYGKGIIQVGTAPIEEFNKDPDAYLRDASGNYQYDVIFFGTWDGNGDGTVNKDISALGAEKVRTFIKTGRGVIFGHDTLTENGSDNPNFAALMSSGAAYMPEPCTKPDGIYSAIGMLYSGCDASPWKGPVATESSKVMIAKKGLLTNYPWEIGDVGTVLTVPACHNRQATTGTIWMRFSNSAYTEEDMSSDANFYLATNNNTAMIQTGHANGQATEDEQMILANLIFYMNQLLFDAGSLRDASAQDGASPEISSHRFAFASDGEAAIPSIQLSAQDFGTTYSYCAESYSKDDTTETGLLATSNIGDATVTTGIARYCYMFDDDEDAIISDVSEGTGIMSSPSADIPYATAAGRYMHVVALDGAGNVSDTYTIALPSPVPCRVDGIIENPDARVHAGQYSFLLTNLDGQSVATASNGEDGTFSFDAGALGIDDVNKTLTYRISQVVPEEANNYIYDEEEELVHVKVTCDEAGNISLSLAYEKGGVTNAEPIPFVNGYAIQMPETGQAGIAIGIAIGTALVIAAICGIVFGRKEDDE